MVKYILLAIIGFVVMVYSVTVPISLRALVAILFGMLAFGWGVLMVLVKVLSWLHKDEDGGEEK